MYDRDYWMKMKPLIKLQIIIVGGVFLLPLLISSVIYISTAFSYCESYSLQEEQVEIATNTNQALKISNGVTAIISNKIEENKQLLFKSKIDQSYSEIIIRTNKPLFPCARAELSVNNFLIQSIVVENAAILQLNIKNETYEQLKLFSGQTVSQFNYKNTTVNDKLEFTGSGYLNFDGQINKMLLVSGASGANISGNFSQVIIDLNGNFYGNLSQVQDLQVFSASFNTIQQVCIPVEAVLDSCVSTLNRHWSGDSGTYYYKNEVIQEAFSRETEIKGSFFINSKIDDVYQTCIGNYTKDVFKIKLANRGATTIIIYEGEIPNICK